MRRALIIIVKGSRFIEVKRSRKREEAWAWSWSAATDRTAGVSLDALVSSPGRWRMAAALRHSGRSGDQLKSAGTCFLWPVRLGCGDRVCELASVAGIADPSADAKRANQQQESSRWCKEWDDGRRGVEIQVKPHLPDERGASKHKHRRDWSSPRLILLPYSVLRRHLHFFYPSSPSSC
jgi:hypothetical protein